MDIEKKIVTLTKLKEILQNFRRQGKTIAFTNGCFDLLHYGHIRYLQRAKHKNRILVVGINSDSSVRKIKGLTRPVIPHRFRAAVIAALAFVDYVTIFSEETPYNLIKALKPDILIKGADWMGKGVVGSDIVKKNRGKVELIRYQKGFSTTGIIKRILKSAKN